MQDISQYPKTGASLSPLKWPMSSKILRKEQNFIWLNNFQPKPHKAVFSCYIFTWTDRLGGIEWDLSLSPAIVLIPDPRQLPILREIIDTICPIHKLRLLTSSSIRSKHIITDFPFIVTNDMYSEERQVWATWSPGGHNNGHTLEFLIITICKLFKSAGDIIFKIQWQGSEVL